MSPLENQHCILFEELPKGTKVNCSSGWVFMLTIDKKINDKCVPAVVVYGPKDQIGRYEPDWCADMLYRHNDETL